MRVGVLFACAVTTVLALSATVEAQLVPTTDLELKMSVSADVITLDAQTVFTLVVKNLGLSAATGVTIVDTLPPGLVLVSASPGCTHDSGVVTCAIGTLVSVESATRLFTVRGAGPGTHTNAATVFSAVTDLNSSNDAASAQVRVRTAPPLNVTSLAQANDVRVSWSSVSGATAYSVYRSRANDPFVQVGSTIQTSFTDLTVASGQSYMYYVTSVSAGGESDPSATGAAVAIPFFPSWPAVVVAAIGSVVVRRMRPRG